MGYSTNFLNNSRGTKGFCIDCLLEFQKNTFCTCFDDKMFAAISLCGHSTYAALARESTARHDSAALDHGSESLDNSPDSFLPTHTVLLLPPPQSLAIHIPLADSANDRNA